MIDQDDNLSSEDLNLVDSFNASYNPSEIDILKLCIYNLEVVVSELRSNLNETIKTNGNTQEAIALIKKSLGLTFYINKDADLETNVSKAQAIQEELIEALSARLSKLEKDEQ